MLACSLKVRGLEREALAASREVEAALLSYAEIVECAVIGARDDERGEVVQARLVLKPGVERSLETAKCLQDHVNATIASYKYPRSIVFVDALPKTPTGKIQRFKLKGEAHL
jgi:2-aminobenzoate-CoA ligase